MLIGVVMLARHARMRIRFVLILFSSVASAYDRSAYRHWVDADGDGQDTRQEILIRDSHTEVLFREDGKVETGLWVCPYTGRVTTNPRDLDIDHLGALGEIDAVGAHSWTAAEREAFANDPENLVAVQRRPNS